ncbi:MAG: hypothetical protein ACK462_07135, partial [Planctomyces sp.]
PWRSRVMPSNPSATTAAAVPASAGSSHAAARGPSLKIALTGGGGGRVAGHDARSPWIWPLAPDICGRFARP